MLHPSPGAIFRRKADTCLRGGGGGVIPYPSLSLNIAWQGGGKGVPRLGCSPHLSPEPRPHRRLLRLFIGVEEGRFSVFECPLRSLP